MESVRILGIQVDSKLSFKQHGEDIVKKFSAKIRLLKNLKFMPKEPLLQFYNKVILPQVLYGVVVWGSTQQTLWGQIERRHAQAARLIEGLPWHTHGPVALRRAGWSPLNEHYKKQLMKLAFDAAYRNCDPVIQKNFFPLQTEKSRYVTRRKLDFRFPAPHSLNIIKKSVCRRAASLWNWVPIEHKAVSSRAALVRALKLNDILNDRLQRFSF